LHKPLVAPRGLFASGKFDQYKRDIPYATLAQAFQSLVRSILAKNEEELRVARDDIHEALGENAQLMVDLVPELALVIGAQPPVRALPSQGAQARFQRVIRQFIGVFTREHPLALFLDDLQWLDAATLDLMEDLLTHPDVSRLMLIGAYRDNEVTATHPLMRRLEVIREAGAIVRDIVLAPLSRNDFEKLIEDSLHCEAQRAGPLAELVEQKTSGNPFFSIQFLSELAEESLIVFDYGEGRWSWDLNSIRDKGFTDNVVDLMVGKLNRLPVATQKALQQLACLGSTAGFAVLRMAYQDAYEEMELQLWEAVRAGLVVRSEDGYRFLHDRVQEAAYSLIPEDSRAAMHLRIGMLMVSHTSSGELEERVFEIVNQLNRGAHLVTSIAQRQRIGQLNLIAGRQARAANAYASALKYLRVGRDVLTEEAWERDHDLVFSIDYLLAECEMLTADLAAAEMRLSMLSGRAKSTHDMAIVTRLRMTLYNLMDRSDRSVEVFIEYQRAHDEHWSPHPTDDEVSREYEYIWSLVGTRKIGELVDLPLITNPDLLDVLDVFAEAVLTTQFTDENLHARVLCRMVGLSLEHGNSDSSSLAYVTLGMLAGPHFGDYETGFRLGKLGYDLVEKYGLIRYQARVYVRFGSLVMPWRHHVKTGRELLRRAFDAANRAGDLTFAAYSCNNLITNLLTAGDPLAEVQREVETGLEFAKKARFGRAIDMIVTQRALVRTLRGQTDKFGTFNDADFDELRFEQHLSSNATLARPACWYWIRKLQARFLAGDYVCAVEASLNAERLFAASQSYFQATEYHFFGALARAAIIESCAGDARLKHYEALVAHARQLASWAENCPENFEHCAVLVDAEVARIDGRLLDAEQRYEKAICSAHLNGFVHNEAVASEVAARFYAARGINRSARAHLRDARHCYLSWGADGKVKQLDQLHSHIKEPLPVAGATGTIEAPAELLDLATVIKVSQALSGEMVLPSLIEKLVSLAVENAGAERGLLILFRGRAHNGEPWIEAQATSGRDGIEVAVLQAAITSADLPQSALHQVIRTREHILLGDASSDLVYSKDEYVRRKHSRSILCLPIVKQAKLFGVLYLENNLAPFVFTSDRVAVLHLLASQAAISLENAELYTDLQRSEAFLAQGQKISHTGSFGWSAGHGEHFWSEEGYNILEYDRNVPASMELALQRIHPDDRERVRRALDAAISEQKDFDSEHRFVMPDGRVKHVHVSGRAVDIGNLEFAGAVRDITERKQAEEALRQALTDLARIHRVTTMGELAASLAHEINQPIAAVITYANACLRWLDRGAPDIDQAHTAITQIVKDGQRAAGIIGRIRAQFEKGALNREFFAVGEVIKATVGLLHSEAVRYNISIRTELAADLPAIFGDRVQLQQVVMNLIVNGIEAMKDVDGVRDMVIRSQRADDGSILVSVSDTGIGVPPQLAEHIFDPFFTTKVHGTGMGLRISRSIVESHGGNLWVASAPGRGATFQFTLPAKVASSA
jgi:predicted ATPase/signal transduction histidine kinase